MEKEPVTRQEQNEQFGFQRKVRFNGEITMGNILTAFTMICVLMGMWKNFEVRMVKIEQMQAFQASSIAAIVLTLDRISERRERQSN